MAETFTYDVFISHSEKDKPAVRELAERLRKDGLRVWFDEWEIKPGDAILLKIQEGLEQSRTLVLVMSQHASASEWVTFEHHSVLFRDPTNQQRRFIPVRLDDAEVRDALKQFAYVDWRQRSEEQYARLLAACRPAAAETESVTERKGQAKPTKIFKGHTEAVWAVAVTPDGQHVVSGSPDNTIRVWKLNSGRCIATLKGHTAGVPGLAVAPDGLCVVSCSWDNTMRVWDLDSRRCLATLEGHTNYVIGVAVTPDGLHVISGSMDNTLRVWELDSGRCISTLKWHIAGVPGVALTPDGRHIISGSMDNTLRIWELDSGRCIATLRGHTDEVNGVTVTLDGRHVISCSDDNTVRVWEFNSRRCLATLEGHTSYVQGVVVTPDGYRIVSGSADGTVRVWELDTGNCIATLEGYGGPVFGVAVTPDGRHIVSGSSDGTVQMWELPPDNKKSSESGAARYTNAKVLLVGDSGVGKSGLALRLTEDRFEPTISTDGAWATQVKLPHEPQTEDIEREILLWDFAGQADYRLVHQLFMDETALAVFVFNPQSENPFEGISQWDHDLRRATRYPYRKLLVAGRCDRGGLMISRESIERFCAEYGFAEYLETSAYTGAGCLELKEAIIRNIPWNEIPWTTSPRIFKLLKGELIRFKDEGQELLRTAELKQQLEVNLPKETFRVEDVRAVIRLLVGIGVVWQLDFGDFILFRPELINFYASALIRSVRAHIDEIGCITEAQVLAGQLDYQDMKRLPLDIEKNVLQEMTQTFVDRGICLREHTERGTLLIFPSYFKRERPELTGHPSPFVTYAFNGATDDIYAVLVVRLHHTTIFDKDQLWRFAADFKTMAGKRIGLKMVKKLEGSAEIIVYCEPDISDDTKVAFVRYIHDYLKDKAHGVKRDRYYVCGNCGTPVTNHETVRKRLTQGKKEIICVDCEKQVPLWDLIEEKFASEETQATVRAMEEQARRAIDNESRELILLGHAFAIAGEAGQIFRPTPNSDWGIDGEIEFKNDKGEASGRRVYLQLKSGDSYLEARKDGREVFKIKKERWAEYWTAQEYPVMLVIRTSDGQIRWMNVTEYLKKQGKAVKQITFDGEPFTAASLWRMRDKVIS